MPRSRQPARSSVVDLETKSEIKFNILLLLRNRYPQGVEAKILIEEYRKYFMKEIDTRIFNPKAVNLYTENRDFLGEDIEVVSMNNKSFIRANQGCSEHTMLLISNASSYQKVNKNQNYVHVKNEGYKGGFHQEYNGYLLKNEHGSSDSDMDVLDPLRQRNASSAINLSSSGSIPHNFASTSAGAAANSSAGHYLETIQRVGSEGTQFAANPAVSTLNYIVPNVSGSQFVVPNSGAPYYIVNYPTGNPVYAENTPASQTTAAQPQATAAAPSASSNSSANKKKRKKGLLGTTGKNRDLHYCNWKGCKKSFRRYKILENHIRLAHHKEEDGALVCSTVGCKLQFSDKRLLQHHEQRCTLKPHRCSWEGCDKTFRTSKLLHGHISAVHRKTGRHNTFKCSTPGCQQAYPDSTKLKVHENRCRFRYEYESEGVKRDHENDSTIQIVDPNPSKSPLFTNDDKMKTAVSQFLNKFEADLNVPVFFDNPF